jgi:hypothetical protein
MTDEDESRIEHSNKPDGGDRNRSIGHMNALSDRDIPSAQTEATGWGGDDFDGYIEKAGSESFGGLELIKGPRAPPGAARCRRGASRGSENCE